MNSKVYKEKKRIKKKEKKKRKSVAVFRAIATIYKSIFASFSK